MKENDGHCTRVGRGTNAYLQCMKPEGIPFFHMQLLAEHAEGQKWVVGQKWVGAHTMARWCEMHGRNVHWEAKHRSVYS